MKNPPVGGLFMDEKGEILGGGFLISSFHPFYILFNLNTLKCKKYKSFVLNNLHCKFYNEKEFFKKFTFFRK